MSSDTIRVRVQSPFIWESSPTEPRNPLMCNDFVPSFATASRYLPPVLSETPYRRRALLP